jgi:hypothetical protein
MVMQLAFVAQLSTLTLLVLAPERLSAQDRDHAKAIAAAVLPLPTPLRSGAGVVRFDASGRPRVWRAGTNGMTCLADRPGDEWFDVRCYQDGFIGVLYRARALYAAGVADTLVERTIDSEIRSGALAVTREPTAGYRMLGPIAGYDSLLNTVSDTIDAWQSIHLPYRTAPALAIPTNENGTHPYVMASGTYWAHVMIMQRPLRY